MSSIIYVTGTRRSSQGRPVRADLRIQGAASSGTIAVEGAHAEVTTLGSDTYLKGNQRGWTALQAPPAVPGFAGRWVKLRSDEVNVPSFSLEFLVGQVTSNDWRLAPKVEQATLDGKKVVVLTQQNGSKLYVANTGPAYPVRIEDKRPRGGQIEFTEYNTDFRITAPVNALSNALTAEESAWLEAVTDLREEVDKVLRPQSGPTEIAITRAKMRSFARTLGSCSRQLSRIGSPGDRLRPIYTLVQQACALHDKASRCFATAARVSAADGSVRAGTREERIWQQAFTCATEAEQDGSELLTDAVEEGNEIRSQLG
jgi:hypothetical protein